MAKRSTGQFARRPQDAYDTPYGAVLPLLSHLQPESRFIEPCAGAGVLIPLLEIHGHRCVGAFDTHPRSEGRPIIVEKGDARTYRADGQSADLFITNPPWSRPILHAIILNLYWQLPTWLLFDADWIHTRQAGPYLPMLRKIVSVGRVRWIEGSEHVGKDNAAWHLFAPSDDRARFYGRLST